MAGIVWRTVSDLRRLPPLTAGNLGLALLGLPVFVVLVGVLHLDIRPVIRIGVYWAIALVVLGISVGGEGLSLTDLGFRRPALIDIGYIVVTSVAILLVYSLTARLVEALGLPLRDSSGAMGADAGITVALALAVTTGIVEEILYRGYPIERFIEYTESPVIAGGLTWIVFTAAHSVSWPLGNLLQTAVVAGILTIVYLRRRTLFPVIGAHVLVWIFATLGQIYG